MPRHNVVITGLGVVSSIGIGGDAYFDALLAQRSGIRSLLDRTDDGAKPHTVSDPPGLWIGGPIVDFEPKQYVRPRKALKVMCREIQTAFAASQLAIEHAGLQDILPAVPDGQLAPADIGTVFGGEMYYGPPAEMLEPIVECLRDDGTIDVAKFGHAARRAVMPLWMLRFLPNMPACHVGISVNAHGPNNTLVVGDVSGPAALIESVSCIERGIAKLVITGATGTRINTTRMNYRNDLPIATVADPIANSSRPHDPDSDGVVGGEAAAAMILESELQARERGGNIIARIIAAVSRFAPSPGMPAQRSDRNDQGDCRGSQTAIRLAINGALAEAEISSQDVGLIVSHAMGDPQIDAAERAAITGELIHVPMVAPMASLGHSGAASGSMAIATGALALARRKIPPTLNADQAIAVNFLTQPKPLEKDYVLCLAHTSEGSATAVVLSS